MQVEDVELSPVVEEGPSHLGLPGVVRDRVAHDREQPEDHQPGGSQDRGERRSDVSEVMPHVEHGARDQESG